MTINNPSNDGGCDRRPQQAAPTSSLREPWRRWSCAAAVLGHSLPRTMCCPRPACCCSCLRHAVALVAWRRPRRRGPRLTYWDVAGALTLIGICVAAAIEPEQMVRLVAGTDRTP